MPEPDPCNPSEVNQHNGSGEKFYKGISKARLRERLKEEEDGPKRPRRSTDENTGTRPNMLESVLKESTSWQPTQDVLPEFRQLEEREDQQRRMAATAASEKLLHDGKFQPGEVINLAGESESEDRSCQELPRAKKRMSDAEQIWMRNIREMQNTIRWREKGKAEKYVKDEDLPQEVQIIRNGTFFLFWRVWRRKCTSSA